VHLLRSIRVIAFARKKQFWFINPSWKQRRGKGWLLLLKFDTVRFLTLRRLRERASTALDPHYSIWSEKAMWFINPSWKQQGGKG